MLSASSLDLRRSVLDLVHDVRDILTEGNEVRVKIINIDREKSRIPLSIKQLEEDPLLETLDKVIHKDASVHTNSLDSNGSSVIEPLPGLETIIEELLQEDGRQGFEKRVVSQDLQLWLSNAAATGDQFTLLARAGRQESFFTSYSPPSTTSHASANVKRLLMVRLAVQSYWVRLNSSSGSKRSLEFRCCTVAVQEAKVAS
ncbi:hypothetical protein CQW23_22748 [Capsicum baccatum]|uniref:S1 motif domain-containing protein n=1 Tax=Capsicum baccatum TaxID=33114 RepID=A0A2G2W1R6_CAPBA|nr:hypothetical protein CQW23_22748 [Capsicum baccatum]